MKKKAKSEIDKITVINLLPRFKFPHIVTKNILLNVFDHFHCKPDDINIVFMGDGDITRINSKFLSHKYPTDVISFTLDITNADISNGKRDKVFSNSFKLDHRPEDGLIPSLLDSTNANILNHEVAIEAELYIGVEEVRRNSILYRTKFYEEVKRVIIHGTLHLIGFGDKNQIQRDEMRAWEEYFLSVL